MKKNLLTCCLAIVFLLWVNDPVDAKVPDAVLQQTKTVVMIYVDDKNGRRILAARGTIADTQGIIVTGCSVIEKWAERFENTLTVETKDGSRFQLHTLLSRKCGHSLAFFTIGTRGLPAAKLSLQGSAKKADKIVVFGSVSEKEGPLLEGTVKNINRKQGVTDISVPPDKLANGSPVFNNRGEVVAIALKQIAKKRQEHLIVPVQYLSQQLTKHRETARQLMIPEVFIPPSSVTPDTGIQQERALDAERLMRIEKALFAVQMNKNDAQAYFKLGIAYEDAAMYQDAVQAYRQTVRISPDYVDGYVSLGIVYYKTADYNRALKAFHEALNLRPNNLSIYNKLGTIYIIKGSYTMAVRMFREALEISPRNAELRFNLGLAYYLGGERYAAAGEYAVLKEIDKERAEKLADLMY